MTDFISAEQMAVYRRTALARERARQEANAQRRAKALVLAGTAALLRQQFGAERVLLSGSTMYGYWFTAESDIDLAVEGIAADQFWRAAAAVDALDPAAVQMDGGKLEGSNWQAELLRQMTFDLPGVRPAVLRQRSAEQLDELRSFRHLVRNIYTADLVPRRMQPLVEMLPDLWIDVRGQLEAFAAYLHTLSRADEDIEAN